MIDELTPWHAAERLRSEDPPLLLDVREDWEVAAASLDDAVHIPMAQVPDRLAELPTDRPVMVLCHHGQRSMRVALWLQSQGFTDVANLAGGIDAWSEFVDADVPRYT